MVWSIALNRVFMCVVALWLGFISPLCKARIYTNHWAVRITGGPGFADRIAEKYGYKNMGQIGDLKDYYHFFHSRTIKRSTLSSRGRHSFISMEPQVEWIQQQVVKRRVKRDYKAGPSQSIYFNDAKWTSMWYIHCNDDVHNCQSDMNIMGAWNRGYTGKNVVVTILDDGIERNHPDLVQNYDTQASYDVNGNDLDPMPRYDASNENKHGTRCAGEVAASANNSHCTVGIAYNAKIGGVRMLDGDVTDMVEAKSLSLQPQHIDIYSASWGPDDDGKTVDGPASLARQAFENGIRMGRKGRGSIFVWASGNGGRSRDHCSCDGYTNSIYTISISSTAESGKKPWYLEECASTLTTTYSSGENYDRKIITTDLRQRCTDSHTGTSASAPMAAGIIALALEANPLLSWRDVQHIIVKTSRAGHLSAPDWKTNAAGYNVSHLYGFGLMDAEAMVKEAERWRQVPPQHVCVESADRQFRTIRPEHVVRSVYKATGCSDNPNHHVIYLEHVVVRITITHPRRGDLSINLTSPSGTKSQLLANRLFDHSMEGFKNWEFMTTHCWGEKAAGDWVLEIYDSPSQLRSQKVPGKLKEWSLVLYGTSVHPYSSLRYEKTRSAEPPTDYDLPEEYNGLCHPECNENGCEGPGPHQCINCLHYFLKFKNNTRMCVSECPSGFFRDDKRRCKKCYSLCEKCMGGRSDQCTSCKPGYHLNEGTNSCVSSCADGYYLDDDANVCRRCSENCRRCTTSTICTECKPGLSLQGNRCLMSCEAGSYYNGHRRTCEPCHRACATCAGTGIEACTKCASNYFVEEWRCVSACSVGFYLAEQTSENVEAQKACRKCDSSCYTCSGPGDRNCTSCVNGYNLERGVCAVSTICKDGEYLSGRGRCRLCDATCYKCVGPEIMDCISCVQNKYYNDGRCVTRCPAGKYNFAGQCHLCHHTCQECSDAGPDRCTSCDRDRFGMERYLFRSQCREVCPTAYYHSQSRTCEPCAQNCDLCTTPNRCLKCASHYYLEEGSCTKLTCGEDEAEDSMYDDCVPCAEGCKKCLQGNPKHCISCMKGYYQFEFQCYKSCPDKTYSDSNSMTCEPCGDQCVTCDDSACFWCEDGYFLSDDKCVQECEEGFYADEESQECEACHEDCETCLGPNYDDCNSCDDGTQLLSGECVAESQLCNDNSFVNSNEECELCHSSCKTCSGPGKNNCDSCEKGRYLTSRRYCMEKCPDTSFANKTTGWCDDCLQGCLHCRDSTQCLKCLSVAKNRLYLKDGRCVHFCLRGFPDGDVCKSCAPQCASCEGNATYCQTCVEPYVLHDHECREGCPPAHFSKAGECQQCPYACQDCTELGLCRECETYYFLHNGGCVDDCPSGFYPDIEQQDCVPCHADCASCDGPDVDDCNACLDPSAVRYKGKCLPECPTSTFHDMDIDECRDCDESCLTCSGPQAFACRSCRSDMRLDNHGHCVFSTECPLRTYMDQEGRCLQCHAICQQCLGPGKSQCLSCNEGHFLLNRTCVEQCPAGFYEDMEQRLCERCHQSCASCRGKHSMDCVSCKPHFFRMGRACMESCSPSYYANMSSMMCIRCDPSCDECDGSGNAHCRSCRKGFFLMKNQGRCHPSCPSGFYEDNAKNTCERCHATCKSCRDQRPLSCESCYFGYLLAGGICQSQCMLGEYAISMSPSLSCEPCDGSCIACKGPSIYNCTACPVFEILSDDGRCLTCCKEVQEGSPLPWECCNCTASKDECVMSVNFEFRDEEDYEGKPALFATTSVLLIVGIGVGVYLFLKSRSKEAPKPKPGGYEKLNNSGTGPYSKPMTSYEPSRSEQLVEFNDRAEEEDDDDDEDIVYMGQDGTVYRKFKYGALDDDEEDELEYDDESYSFR
ncbi:proprotein convertase subtilisin/kexin type 5b isoform X2 [Paramormyrops kingsleyae]|uniref:proprotein convertase subtilisin/kexin type 5b isoform X2 n=1 Tax=Paramormyrops kingsleyae TaxID=1676925 RepID=UPI003B978B5F